MRLVAAITTTRLEWGVEVGNTHTYVGMTVDASTPLVESTSAGELSFYVSGDQPAGQ